MGDVNNVVRYFPYRTSIPSGHLLELEYETGDCIDRLRKMLFDFIEKQPDNHVGFMVELYSGKTCFYWFSDHRFVVSTRMETHR